MRLLFVCMGNICRSPTAEGVFRHLARSQAPERYFEIDSAGTHDYHVGAPPDPRAQEAALRRGVDLSALRARLLVPEDFRRFDLVLVMDRQNLRAARSVALRSGDADATQRLALLLDYAPQQPQREVPDPYYGTVTDFELVLDLCFAASRGLLERLR